MKKIKLPRRALNVAIRLVLIAAVLFGGYRWINGEDSPIYASNVSIEDLLAYEEGGEKPLTAS